MDWLLLVVYFLYFFALFVILFWLVVYFEKGVDDKKLKPKKYPFVSIVVPAWNEEGSIEGTLKSLISLRYPKNKFEVVIINDGSTDKTSQVVEKFISYNPEFNLKLINQKNAGKAAALNRALKVIKGEIFVCLDADSFIAKDALYRLVPYFENDPNLGVIMPLMRVTKPITFIQKVQWIEYIINYLYKRLMSKLDMVHVAPGPFSVYRKSIVVEVGGFDEDSLTEDLELTLKIQKADYKVIQTGDTDVFTNTPKNLKAFYRQRNRWYKGSFISILKHKDMIFKKKYGDFGFFQAPFILINGLIAIVAAGLVFYRFLYLPLSKFIVKFGSINFDPSLFFAKFNWDFFNLMGIDYFNVFLAFLFIILSFIIMGFALNHTKENFFRYGILVVPVYLMMYGVILSFIWAGVWFDLLRGKVQKW